MSEFELLSGDLGSSSRTLRRAAARGLIRHVRVSPNKARLPAEEHRYLRSHWPLLRTLVAALRTEHGIRLAVLFGSVARGSDHAASDIDLLVSPAGEGGLTAVRLSHRLEALVGRRVQVVPLREAHAAPLLLADALRDGRVLVDRDGDWERLKSRERTIMREAEREERRLDAVAWDVLERLDESA